MLLNVLAFMCKNSHNPPLHTFFFFSIVHTHTTIAALTQQPMRCDFDDIRFIFNSGSIHQFKSNQRPVIAVTTPTCWLCLCTLFCLPFFHPSHAILSHLYFITNRGLHNMRHFRGYITGKTVSNLYIKIHNKAIQVKNVQTTDV